MTTEISDAFVTQFERDVHLAYQRMGSILRNTIRTKNGVVGSTTTFQVAGKGNAGSKSRHGQVPIMNASRDPVTCTLSDRYAGEYIDKLDETKINHDERDVIVKTLTGAFGRDTDDFILTALDAGTNASNQTATTWSAASSLLNIQTIFGNADIPMDGNLFAAVCWEAWADLLDIDEFARMEYIGAESATPLWHSGVQAKMWLGFNWFPHSGLTLDSSNDRKQYFYHREAVGHAIQQDMSLDISWQGKEQAHLFVGSMAQGAVIIDQAGVLECIYDI